MPTYAFTFTLAGGFIVKGKRKVDKRKNRRRWGLICRFVCMYISISFVIKYVCMDVGVSRKPNKPQYAADNESAMLKR